MQNYEYFFSELRELLALFDRYATLMDGARLPAAARAFEMCGGARRKLIAASTAVPPCATTARPTGSTCAPTSTRAFMDSSRGATEDPVARRAQHLYYYRLERGHPAQCVRGSLRLENEVTRAYAELQERSQAAPGTMLKRKRAWAPGPEPEPELEPPLDEASPPSSPRRLPDAAGRGACPALFAAPERLGPAGATAN